MSNEKIIGATVSTPIDPNKFPGGGSSITVDAELSDTSTNPVQNKVITEAFGGMASEFENVYTAIETLQPDENLSSTSIRPIQNGTVAKHIGFLNEKLFNIEENLTASKVFTEEETLVGFILTNGSLVSAVDYRSTDFVAVAMPRDGSITVKSTIIQNCSLVFYDKNKTVILGINGENIADYGYTENIYPQERNFPVPEGTAYIRLSAYAPNGLSEGDLYFRGQIDISAITTAILCSEQTLSDGKIPSYWDSHLDSKIAHIKSLQAKGGKDCFSFVAIADVHYRQNLTKRSPLIAKRIMDECNIKFALCLGDMQNGAPEKDEALCKAEWDGINKMFEPIRDRTLMALGNHDGAWGTLDKDGDGTISGLAEYYCYNLKPEELFDYALRRTGLIDGVHFDKSGNGYYVDDTASKVRYIMLNTNAVEYAENEDGTAVNNVMRKFQLMQDQHDMVIEALTTIPSDSWSVVIGSHCPLTTWAEGTNAFTVVTNILNAYQHRTTYFGTSGVEGEWDYVSVNVDFTNAKGTVAGAFSGHLHLDQHTIINKIPYVCIGNDCGGSDGIPKINGTDQEQSFDVITVNRKEGTIYCTKIGAGENRSISVTSYTNVADPTSSDWHVGTAYIAGDRTTHPDTYGTPVPSTQFPDTVVTNYIPVVKNDILRFKGMDMDKTCSPYTASMYFYDENKTCLLRVVIHPDDLGKVSGMPTSCVADENGVITYEVALRGDTNTQWNYNAAVADNVRYVRFCAPFTNSVSDIIITVNEEIG